MQLNKEVSPTTADIGSSRQHILDVATELFSQKGFAATRVDEIARKAEVNKAMIYYYFPSKEALLDHLIESFFVSLSSAGISFVQDTFLRLKQEKRLNMFEDRIEFATEDDLKSFIGETMRYYDVLLNWLLNRRQMVRIILTESLSDRKHEGALLKYFVALEQVTNNPEFADFAATNYKGGEVFNKFFFTIMPLISFSAYSENYVALSGEKLDSLKKHFLSGIMAQSAGYIKGTSIMFQLTT